MYQNIITKGSTNPVIILFGFRDEFAINGLANFDEITLEMGGELYSTVNDPDKLFVRGKNELRLMIGGTTTLKRGEYIPTIKGYSSTYNGYEISSPRMRLLQPIKVI